jgi:hypothetical protein
MLRQQSGLRTSKASAKTPFKPTESSDKSLTGGGIKRKTRPDIRRHISSRSILPRCVQGVTVNVVLLLALPRAVVTPRPDSDGQIMIANPLAENHQPGGTGPPEPRESPVVQAVLSPLNLLRTTQLRKLPLVARHWHSACILSGRPVSRARWRYLLRRR